MGENIIGIEIHNAVRHFDGPVELLVVLIRSRQPMHRIDKRRICGYGSVVVGNRLRQPSFGVMIEGRIVAVFRLLSRSFAVLRHSSRV